MVGSMPDRILVKATILIVVIVAAAVIIYPKISGTKKQESQAKSEAAASAQIQSESPGEAALGAALKSGKPTMILFHSNSCIPCKEMSAIVAEVQPQYAGRANFVDILVDDQAEARLISNFGINTIPTSVFFDKMGELVGKNVGVIKKEQLMQLLSGLEK